MPVRNKVKAALLFCALVINTFFTSLVSAQSPHKGISDWSLEKDDDGIAIFSRAIEGSKFREFKATMTIDTTIDAIIAVFQDPNSFTQWVHQCSQAEVIEQPSFLEIYVYQVSDMPLLVSDRDVVIKDLYSYTNDYKEWTIEVSAMEGMVPITDMVRIMDSHGVYKLKENSEGKVDLIWYQHADPAGALPSWLVNTLIVDLPFNTLSNLRELSMQDKYRTSKIGYNDQGIPDHWAVKNF